jgi:hypothetical protein
VATSARIPFAEVTSIWAASGAMALTGRPGGAVLDAPATLGEGLLDLQRAVGDVVDVDIPALLGERAALAGLVRQGATSCGGASRLLQCRDGWCAVTLARPDDVASIPAWLELDGRRREDPDDVWPLVASELAKREGAAVAARAQLLGLPVARLGSGPRRLPVEANRLGSRRGRRSIDGALVVDLSSLWAGPLCSHLLQLAGARVIKVESVGRPDGARLGPPAFFDLLHGGQECVALDLHAAEGRHALTRLLGAADVVVEASRPRALAQLGIDAAAVAACGRLSCWLSITGYGRADPWGHHVGFGDDTAVAGGLVAWDGAGPVFCADAVSDPLTGVRSAAAVLAALCRGDQWLLDIGLQAVAAALGPSRSGVAWQPSELHAAVPRARLVTERAASLGAHTDAVLRELAA